MFKKNYFVKSIIFSFVLLSIIFFSCDKKKIIEDNMNICIESFSLLDSENEGKNLGSDINCDIDINNHTISLTVPSSAELTGLKFNITSCEGTTISPASGEETDFELVENPSEESTEEPSEAPSEGSSSKRYKKVFTVTKGDKSQEYTVYIAKESAPKLTEFKISANESKGIKGEMTAVITDDTDTATGKILLNIPYNGSIDLTGLSFTAAIPDNHVLNPAIGVISESIESKEFTLTKTGTSSQRVYTVEVVKGPYITAFKFEPNTVGGTANTGIISELIGNIDHTTSAISITVPSGVTLSSLIPTITVGENTKSEFTPSTQTDFSSEVKYTVTSSNSLATDFVKEYTVTVTQNAEPTIFEFKFTTASNSNKNLGNDITGDINGSDIIIKVPYNATLTDLTPTVAGASNVKVCKGEDCNTDDANSTATDFSNSHDGSVKYSAVGPAGGRKVYSVKVYKEPKISTFKFIKSQNAGNSEFPNSPTEYDGSVSGNNITITVANTVDVTNLKASITGDNIAANYITPTALNFSTNPQTIEVPNQYLPGYTKTYTVTLTKETAPKLTEFKIPAKTENGIAGEVSATFTHPSGTSNTGTIKLKFPKNNEHEITLTGLTPAITSPEGCTVNPTSNTEVSGEIGSTTFTITKTDTGSKSVYTVEAVKGPFIKSFKFENSKNTDKGINGEISATSIDHNTGAITVTLPATVKKDSEGTENKITLTPTIELGGDSATIDSTSGNSQEFTSDIAKSYTVTANGMTKTYTVTVTRTKSNLAQIKSFEIESGQSSSISENSNGANGRIVVPVSSVPTNTTPAITQSDYATITSPTDAQNFDSYENPITYTVTAENTTITKSYDVYIYDNAKTITDTNLKVTNGSTEINKDSVSIDANTRVITVTVPESTDLSSLTLTLTDTTPSSNLSIEPTDAQDFSGGKEVKYTLKENSDIKGHYWVKVVKSS
ncbi:DUF5018 domain-containing protein [Ichthyobacterium seriolicida]|uniref:Pkd domain containing protein n=1 Tax=Ichthyobacterium seriolicida TaxID=242600 RepID=A0A1J1DW75_9FLAO|nr:hypothetical protein [Ichthyobacterium seriolicida]BAV94113.1 hypothetical protein JBKA6_0100 [Ichthyobacterium seriolicida]